MQTIGEQRNEAQKVAALRGIEEQLKRIADIREKEYDDRKYSYQHNPYIPYK